MKRFKPIIVALMTAVLVFTCHNVNLLASIKTEREIAPITKSEVMVVKDLITGKVTAQTMDKFATAVEVPTPCENISARREITYQPDMIIGADNRVQISNTRQAPYKSICFLLMTYPDGTRSTGTGFLYNSTTVITAGHNLYSHAEGGWATSVAVYPGRSGTHNPYGTFTSVRLSCGADWISSGNPNGDYGTIKLNQAATSGALTVTPKTDSQLRSLSVATAGYPGDKMDPITLDAPMYSSSGTISSTTTYRFYYSCDTFPGQSGSPIYDSSFNVVGIHSGDNGTENIGVKLGQGFLDWIDASF